MRKVRFAPARRYLVGNSDLNRWLAADGHMCQQREHAYAFSCREAVEIVARLATRADAIDGVEYKVHERDMPR